MNFKNRLLIVCVMVFLSTAVFPNELRNAETWLIVGYEHALFWENPFPDNSKIKTTMQSPGINLTYYSFYQGSNFGYFVSDSFLFPSRATMEVDGLIVGVNFDDVGMFISQVGLVSGAGFRHSLTSRLIFKGGIGPSLFLTTIKMKQFSLRTLSCGLGGEVGLKYDFTDSFFIDISLKAGYDFAAYSSASFFSESEGVWNFDYSQLRLHPSISFGINMYSGAGSG